MLRHRFAHLAAVRAALAIATLGGAVASCGREPGAPPAPGTRVAGLLSLAPALDGLAAQVASSGLVAFTKVRVELRRGGAIALDTVVAFPADANEVVLALRVPLAAAAPAAGESLQLTMAYVNAAGDTVFKAGPLTVVATPVAPGRAAPPPVQVPVRYTGPGANAVRVVVSPRTLVVLDGDAFAFSASAQDAAGTAIPGTPIVWASLDPAFATVTTPVAGSGIAGRARGTARVVAQLLTGPVDTVVVNVQLRAATLEAHAGDGQSGLVATALAKPIVVRVTARDGVPVPGVAVSFAVVAGGGSAGAASVTTDASGLASTTWTLGSLVGTQSVVATAAGLRGSPLSFTATGRAPVPVRLTFVAGPAATASAGAPLGPLVVHALDADGVLVKAFDGLVTIGLATASPSAPLLGTLTANAVGGVATFADVRINAPGAGYVLAASASGLISATSSAFAVLAGPAQRLEFGAYPILGGTAGGAMDAISVIARDAAGNLATSFAGTVTLGLATSPAGAVAGGNWTAVATGGVATFTAVTLATAGVYRLSASAPGLVPATGPAFTITAPLPAASPPVAIAAGMDHTCVVRANGKLYCWGANGSGQLGDGTIVARLVPTAVSSALTFAAVSPSSSHTCALTTAGAAHCWGDNSAGQLGNGSFVNSTTPVPVSGGFTWARVLAGAGFTCGYTTTGAGYCWGGAGNRLGNGVNGTVNVPTAIAGGLTFAAMSLFSDNHVCAVATGGVPYCWGYNFDGAVGDNTFTDRSVPTSVFGGLTMSDVASAWFHSCGLSLAGAAYCWGDNNVWQLGWGSPPTDSKIPGAVLGGNVFTTIAAGGGHTCGLKAGGAAYCWGMNSDGNLGDGTTSWRLTPVPVLGGLSFIRLSAGNGYTCGIVGTSVYCWGINSGGQLGDGTTTGRLVPTVIPLP